jgi:hypothetical protein
VRQDLLRYGCQIREGHDAAALRVSLADKLDNARAVFRDLRLIGNAVWERFNAGRDDQLWYYRALVEAYRARAGGPMVDELDRLVRQIEGEAARG